MRKLFVLLSLSLVFTCSSFAQDELNSKGEKVAKNEQNAAIEWKSGEKITRGSALNKAAKKASVEKVLAKAGQVCRQNGVGQRCNRPLV